MADPDMGGRDLILVTGAGGFVGSAIADAARAVGYRIRVLARPASPRTNISPLDEVFVGDLRAQIHLDRDRLLHAVAIRDRSTERRRARRRRCPRPGAESQ